MSGRTKVLLLVGGPWYHDQPEHREALSAFIGAKFDLTMTDDMSVLTPENLAKYDVIANFTTFFEPPKEQVDALLEAIKGGKGFVSIHGGTATFWNSPEYVDMIGKFMVHDPFKEFEVKMSTLNPRVVVYPHPITEGMADFTIEDELYVIEGDMTQWEIIGRAEGHPILYNKMYGKGRVHNNALGHDTRAINNPSFQTLVINAIEWAAGLR
ncbi:MAG: ThuA domain-containing protein [Chloroflexi bacterium]|nr:ThuA domain-containing protein [Chloroflexota bacterium]